MPQTNDSKHIALFMAAIVSLITGGGLVLGHFLFRFNFGIVLGVLCGLVFIVVYLFSNYLIREFVTTRILPIYQLIFDENISKKEIRNRYHSGSIEEVNDDVVTWRMQRTNEIKRLYETERYRKEFLGNVSHELKTPLFNIQGYILTLLDGGMDDSSINRLYLEYAEKNITRLISIVEDLNAITLMESEGQTLNMERFDIVKLVQEVFEALEQKARLRNIKLLLPIDKPLYVYADRKGIFQVLMNLVVNSINYGRDKGTTQVRFSIMSDRILVDVSDNGIGIESKEFSRIFERFYRIDKHRSRDDGGSGLGLAIVKHIIETHNQSIRVRSKPNEGSAFTFTLEKA